MEHVSVLCVIRLPLLIFQASLADLLQKYGYILPSGVLRLSSELLREGPSMDEQSSHASMLQPLRD